MPTTYQLSFLAKLSQADTKFRIQPYDGLGFEDFFVQLVNAISDETPLYASDTRCLRAAREILQRSGGIDAYTHQKKRVLTSFLLSAVSRASQQVKWPRRRIKMLFKLRSLLNKTT